MTDRRTFLTGLGTATLGSSSAYAAATSNQLCQSGDAGASAERFPNVLIYAHDAVKHRFYDDLIKGKVCMLQFMSINSENEFQHMHRLQALQELLGDRLGKDFFLYSITVEPETDNLPRLTEYAKHLKTGPGWKLLTGQPADIQKIKDSLFYSSIVGRQGHQDCSMGLIRYGNDQVGIWGSVPTNTEPQWLAQRLYWVQSRTINTATAPKRRGPPARLQQEL